MTDNLETTTEAPVKRGRGRPKKVVVEATPELLTEVPPVTEESELLTPPVTEESELLTEVPPVTEESELLTEVPPVIEDDSDLLTEVPPADVLFETPATPPAPMTPIVDPTPPAAPEEKKKDPSSTHYTAAQIKKLRSAYSRRTLQTRFGITW
jgi:hypothetical protein